MKDGFKGNGVHKDDAELRRLLQACLEDESTETAWEELMKRYRRRIYAQALRRNIPPAEAEDLAQEAMIRLYQHRRRIVELEKPASFFSIIVSNLVKDYWRQHGAHPLVALDGQPHPAGAIVVPDETLTQDDQQQFVREAVGKLPQRQREVCDRLLRGESRKDVAAQLGITIGAVYAACFQATQGIRKLLGVKGGRG